MEEKDEEGGLKAGQGEAADDGERKDEETSWTKSGENQQIRMWKYLWHDEFKPEQLEWKQSDG